MAQCDGLPTAPTEIGVQSGRKCRRATRRPNRQSTGLTVRPQTATVPEHEELLHEVLHPQSGHLGRLAKLAPDYRQPDAVAVQHVTDHRVQCFRRGGCLLTNFFFDQHNCSTVGRLAAFASCRGSKGSGVAAVAKFRPPNSSSLNLVQPTDMVAFSCLLGTPEAQVTLTLCVLIFPLSSLVHGNID